MPVTNRGGLPSGDYLKAQPPSWQSVQAGLAVFALFVIVRYCVQRIYSWLRPSERNLPSHPGNFLLQQRYQPHPWQMDEKVSQGMMNGQRDVSSGEESNTTTATSPIDPHWMVVSDAMPRHIISRLPPAPPLTPPELSTAVFTLDDHPASSESFIHQPNPDYMASTETTSFQVENSESTSTLPRRRSYTRTLPLGIPVPRQAQSSEAELADSAISPSSYPPSTGLLPPAPPSGLDSYEDGQGQRNVDVQGEIISVLDRDGAGWTRHTRVYGGGACLACAAAGGHGGGFYGATVTPEEMR